MTDLTSTLRATYLNSPYTAGAFGFLRDEEDGPWTMAYFLVLDFRRGMPETVEWVEPLNTEPIALNEDTARIRDEFKEWVEKSKKEVPSEA